jgi:hypothetical protein
VRASSSAKVTVTQNSIYDNGHAEIVSEAGAAGSTMSLTSPAVLGIDFGVNGITLNDITGCAGCLPDCAPMYSAS